MRGRTNISGGGAAEIYADTELFTVAEGSNVTAGNFVQYKMQRNDRKYDTNSGFNYNFYKSGNEAPKVLPCGNGRYVRRYKDYGETNITHFELIDVTNQFNVISSMSFTTEYIPSFCLLEDGNIAICYMKNTNSFTIRIYDISSLFLLLNSYEFTEEKIGNVGVTHITQLGDSRIVVNKLNDCMVFSYYSGGITENKYINLGINLIYEGHEYEKEENGDNDWNIYGMEEDKMLIFTLFHDNRASSSVEYVYCAYLLKINSDSSSILDEKIIKEARNYATYNCAIWGNAFGVDKKILFSDGTTEDGRGSVSSTNVKNYYETKIYYCENDLIMQSGGINTYEEVKSYFDDLKADITDYKDYSNKPVLDSSGTAQFTKNNVFYVAVKPKLLAVYRKIGDTNYSTANIDSKSRTAIYRVEFNPISKTFSSSNAVTFELDSDGYYFGFGQFFENNSGDVYYLYETSRNDELAQKKGRWLMKISYKNGVLSIGGSTGMVENYNASGAAIGVAKQSGREGQMVEVYVPKV